jgi:hypothetical protein
MALSSKITLHQQLVQPSARARCLRDLAAPSQSKKVEASSQTTSKRGQTNDQILAMQRKETNEKVSKLKPLILTHLSLQVSPARAQESGQQAQTH